MDYIPAAGTISLPAGTTRASIPVRITSDGDALSAEYFYVKIVNPVGGAIVDGQAQVSFQDCGIICTPPDTAASLPSH